MNIKSRTIDNLGIGANERYAKDQYLIEPGFVKDSLLVPQKTEISVLRPYVPTEFEQLFSVGKQVSWASFNPPPNYFSETSSLFSHQIIPSLGEYEKQEADEDKLSGLKNVLEEASGKQNLSEKESEEAEKERQTLVSLFECVHGLNKTLSLINARRNQYQRG
jgi:hypothetical protein